MTNELTVGSLFSGIGGLDLGLERAGMRVIWQSEIDPYACRVLAKHWPEVPNLGDIKRIDWRDVVRPDVICGGYPCQPFSLAGARQGEEDPRHLWPWVREAIRVLRPRYAILENVRGHLSLGGTTVLSEIAALGYSAEWRIVSAASVGANHRRDRVVIVAYPNGGDPTNGRKRPPLPSQDRSGGDDRKGSDRDPREITLRGTRENPGDVAHADDARSRTPRRGAERKRASSVKGRQQLAQPGPGRRGAHLADPESRVNVRGIGSSRDDRGEVYGGDNFARRTAGYAGGEWWQTEPDVGRVAHGVPSRVDRLKGLGNAVVPQVAEVIGRLVVAHAGT